MTFSSVDGPRPEDVTDTWGFQASPAIEGAAASGREAKEGLEVQPETEVIASITYQSLFRRFEKLSSMSGTALTEAGASFRAALLSTTRHTRAPRAACPETPDPTQPQRNSGRYTS